LLVILFLSFRFFAASAGGKQATQATASIFIEGERTNLEPWGQLLTLPFNTMHIV